MSERVLVTEPEYRKAEAIFEREPYEPVEPSRDLRRLENVVLTPHVGSNTREANRRMAESALANVRYHLAGRRDMLAIVE